MFIDYSSDSLFYLVYNWLVFDLPGPVRISEGRDGLFDVAVRRATAGNHQRVRVATLQQE